MRFLCKLLMKFSFKEWSLLLLFLRGALILSLLKFAFSSVLDAFLEVTDSGGGEIKPESSYGLLMWGSFTFPLFY